jgi:elongation factor P
MIEINDVKKNSKLIVDGFPYAIVDFEHVKPGKGNSFTRCRLKNLVTNQLLERTFKSGEKFPEPNIDHKVMQYLYAEAEMLYFMDLQNYEQIIIPQSLVGEQRPFLLENMECGILFYNDKPIQVELPIFVNLPIQYCEPGFKGDTATGASKPATLAGGHVVKVPLHLKEGDVLKIDTRTGDYIEKVNK